MVAFRRAADGADWGKLDMFDDAASVGQQIGKEISDAIIGAPMAGSGPIGASSEHPRFDPLARRHQSEHLFRWGDVKAFGPLGSGLCPNPPHSARSRHNDAFAALRLAGFGQLLQGRLLLAHLGAQYDRHEVDVVDRSDRFELLGNLNPALRVPTLVLDDGRSLGESNAILWYLGQGTPYVSKFLVGERYTIADIALYAYTHVAGEGGFDLSVYPAIAAWLERVASQPRHVPITV